MSALWSRALELLGRIRLGFSIRRKLTVGHPGAPDAQGGRGWRNYLSAERLFDVWGPVPGSPWVPFHCVPLFAALDRLELDTVGPTRPDEPDQPGPLQPALPAAAAPTTPPALAAPPAGAALPAGPALPPPPVPAAVPKPIAVL
ncbi:MAG TPA: hypothetical protein VD793_00385, partial [Gemmatimonadales bacterium]|nr:hypothetical protein [Gemmatimonadales bacterium]